MSSSDLTLHNQQLTPMLEKNALKKFQPWFGFLSLFFIEQAGSKMKSDSRYRHGNFLWFLWSLPII